jgi:hypothetical protein
MRDGSLTNSKPVLAANGGGAAVLRRLAGDVLDDRSAASRET